MREYLEEKLKTHRFRTFTKKERSSFSYWFNHWKAFNLTAYYLGCWKFKYLFHDIEKPWLKLFLPYTKVQEIHRKNNRHHLEYKKGIANIDWPALIIDNECSRFTKSEATLTAREFVISLMKDEKISRTAVIRCFETLHNLNL